MRKFIAFVLLFSSIMMLSSCVTYVGRRGRGYDTQTWIPRKHGEVPLRSFTGYPRGGRR